MGTAAVGTMITPAYELLRPCGREYPEGRQFGEWGPRWGYHLDAAGNWVPGQICRICKKDVKSDSNKYRKAIWCSCRHPDPAGQHGGPDIETPTGTVLKCPGAGNALRAGWQDDANKKRGYGLSLVLELDTPIHFEDGTSVRPTLTIAHLSELWIPRGSAVLRGYEIGKSGSTGNSTGPHCHTQLELPGPWPRRPIPFKWVLA